jgi:diacylglycerol kinase
MAGERPTWPAVRLKSLSYAFRGLGILFATQPNARIHALFALAACVLGVWLRITAVEWGLLILCIGAVFTAEAFNTALEFLADEVTLETRERIRLAKDLSAAAVLLACLASAIVGLVIFLPRLAQHLPSFRSAGVPPAPSGILPEGSFFFCLNQLCNCQ